MNNNNNIPGLKTIPDPALGDGLSIGRPDALLNG